MANTPQAARGNTEAFELRCCACAYLARHGCISLQEAVDGLQAAAVATGLIEQFGQNIVQHVMGLAVEPYGATE